MINQTLNKQTLKVATFTLPARSLPVTADTLFRRNDQPFLKGLKIQFRFDNTSGQDVVVHYAVLQLKGDLQDDTALDGIPTSFVQDNMWRNYEGEGEKTKDWVQDTVNYQPTYTFNSFNPMIWNVIMKRKKFLHVYDAGNSGTHTISIDKYIAINKRIAMREADDTIGSKPFIFLVWWTTTRKTNFNAASACDIFLQGRTYFH